MYVFKVVYVRRTALECSLKNQMTVSSEVRVMQFVCESTFTVAACHSGHHQPTRHVGSFVVLRDCSNYYKLSLHTFVFYRSFVHDLVPYTLKFFKKLPSFGPKLLWLIQKGLKKETLCASLTTLGCNRPTGKLYRCSIGLSYCTIPEESGT